MSSDISACKLCGRTIGWVETADGRRKPFDIEQDGTLGKSHFQTCKVFRRRCAEKEARKKAAREAEDARTQGRLFA